MWSPRGGVVLTHFAALIVGVTVLVSCSSTDLRGNAAPFHAAHGSELCVATDLPAPGFWEGPPRNPTGGFEYELARDLARQMGLKGVRVVPTNREQLNNGVPSGCDVGMAQTDITEERLQRMAFSVPYYTAELGVLAKAGHDIPDLYTARKQVWGAEKGSRNADFVRDTIRPDKPLRTFANFGESVKALKAGRIDAILTDLPLALIQAKSSKNLAVPAQFVTGDTYGAAIRDEDNVEPFNVALRGLIADGTVDDLAKKWLDPRFSDDPADVPAIDFEGAGG